MTPFDTYIASRSPIAGMRFKYAIARSAKTLTPFLGGQPTPRKGFDVLVANLGCLQRISKTPVKGCDGKRLYAVEFWEVT